MLTTTNGFKGENLIVPANQTFHAILQDPHHPHRLLLPIVHMHPPPSSALLPEKEGGDGIKGDGKGVVLLPLPSQVERAKLARLRGILTPRLSNERVTEDSTLDLPILTKKIEALEVSNKSISKEVSSSSFPPKEEPILTDVETGTTVLILIPLKKEEDALVLPAASEYSSVKESKVENYVVFTKQSSVTMNTPLPTPSRSRIILEKLCLDTSSKAGFGHHRPENLVVKTFSSPRHMKWKQMDEALFSSASATSPEEGTLSRSGDEEVIHNNNGAGSPLYIRRHPTSP